jgi:hypothetical protein
MRRLQRDREPGRIDRAEGGNRAQQFATRVVLGGLRQRVGGLLDALDLRAELLAQPLDGARKLGGSRR